jgi:DNA-binding winged helix-turn-helix (wHTH) protein
MEREDAAPSAAERLSEPDRKERLRIRFEDCVFDSDTREVLRSGRSVPLSPKAFHLLEILIRERPKAIDRRQIHKELWPGIYVSEANLPNLISELRAALRDDSQRPRIIRTVRTFGYAFRAPATAAGPVAAPSGRRLLYRLVWGDREIALAPGENLIGREEDALIWIDDAQVSRRHARILVGESGAVLEDLGSKNGTYLRGKRIRSAADLADGDLIAVGPASMVFRVLRQTQSTASAADHRSD